MAGLATGALGGGTLDNKGGTISAGGGGPSGVESRASVGFDSGFNVQFGGGRMAQLAPWIAIALIGLAWIVTRRR